MSLKQWHEHGPIVDETDEEFSLAASRISVRSPGSPDSAFFQDSTQALEPRTPTKKLGDTGGDARSDTPLNPAMWQMWQEMEGDEDGSGEIAMLCGDLDHDKACIDSRREFHSDPTEGWVMLKSSDLPAWAGASPVLPAHRIFAFSHFRAAKVSTWPREAALHSPPTDRPVVRSPTPLPPCHRHRQCRRRRSLAATSAAAAAALAVALTGATAAVAARAAGLGRGARGVLAQRRTGSTSGRRGAGTACGR